MRSISIGLLIFAFACGSSSKGNGDEIDAGVEEGECGNGIVEGSEQCDDGNVVEDDQCLGNCMFACGDGVVNDIEQCDTAIGAGEPGACPTDCDDQDPCTIDTVIGSECETSCDHAAITSDTDGDGCCQAGATSLDDSDCSVVCGNGVVESGEACDTGITAGNAGACPQVADCNDNLVCTTDLVADDGTCIAACSNPDITQPADNDGCCPNGATIGNDNDCAGICGDGILTSPEACDTAIPSGQAGACPVQADCVDNDPCTEDNLVGTGCNQACSNPDITSPINNDGCCPAAANEQTDNDCQPVCGNNVVETGEQCDDNNTTPGDGCDQNCQIELTTTAFRFTDIDLRDPHTLIDIFGCRDLTDTTFFGFSTNGQFQDAVQTDTDGDGLLDLSPLVVFDPLDQSAGTNSIDVVFADCTEPMSSTMCSGGTPTPSTATNMSSGTCLGILNGTVRPYTPAVTEATAQGNAQCFSSDSETITIDLAGIVVTLTDARVAARYSGDPATGLVNGLVRGFISEADADATILPASLPVIGGDPLSSVLPGGTNNCSGNDDRDVGPDGSTLGWYFYMNFSATVVPYTP